MHHKIAILKAEESVQITTHFFGGQIRAADHFLSGPASAQKATRF